MHTAPVYSSATISLMCLRLKAGPALSPQPSLYCTRLVPVHTSQRVGHREPEVPPPPSPFYLNHHQNAYMPTFCIPPPAPCTHSFCLSLYTITPTPSPFAPSLPPSHPRGCVAGGHSGSEGRHPGGSDKRCTTFYWT